MFLVLKPMLLVCVIKRDWGSQTDGHSQRAINRKINLKSSTVTYNYISKLSTLQEFLFNISEVNQDCYLLADHSLPKMSVYLLLQLINSAKFQFPASECWLDANTVCNFRNNSQLKLYLVPLQHLGLCFCSVVESSVLCHASGKGEGLIS